MTKTKALKNFISKFLGYEATGNSVTSVLTDTTENAEGGGGGGSKSPIFIINATWDDDVENYIFDKTFEEIWDAIHAGAIAIVRGVVDVEGYQTSINISYVASINYVFEESKYTVCVGKQASGTSHPNMAVGTSNEYPKVFNLGIE